MRGKCSKKLGRTWRNTAESVGRVVRTDSAVLRWLFCGSAYKHRCPITDSTLTPTRTYAANYTIPAQGSYNTPPRLNNSLSSSYSRSDNITLASTTSCPLASWSPPKSPSQMASHSIGWDTEGPPNHRFCRIRRGHIYCVGSELTKERYELTDAVAGMCCLSWGMWTTGCILAPVGKSSL
jgi:hypothetical protein